MAMAHFHSSPWRSVLVVLVLLGNLATVPDLFATPAQTPDASRRLYDRVMEEFRHKDYDAALAGFRFFLELHGQSALSANAQYWMGECQYRMGHFKDALGSFYNVISYYPLSQKLAASTLKIGQIYTRQGDREKAQMMYERVTDQYPDSAEADVARKTLETAAAKNEPVAAEPS
ncbi:MAG: tol-pal system protein YbgF [Nitrospira defluvii]|nr:tol-pal system protein YbgF [Nitrospira defluvii]